MDQLHDLYFSKFEFTYQAGDAYRYNAEFNYLILNFDEVLGQCYTQFFSPSLIINQGKVRCMVSEISYGYNCELFASDIAPFIKLYTHLERFKWVSNVIDMNEIESAKSSKLVYKKFILPTKTTRPHNHYKVYRKLPSDLIMLTTYDHEHAYGKNPLDYVFWYVLTGEHLVAIATNNNNEDPSSNFRRIASQSYLRL